MVEGTKYISSQVGGELADRVLDPLDKLGEYYDKIPEDYRPKKLTRIRKTLKPASQLLKRGKKENKKK